MKRLNLIIDALSRSVPVVWTDKDQADRHMEALAAARELQELGQEPVAWITDNYEQDRSATTYSADMANRWRDKGWRVAPLYTTSPKREWVGLKPDRIGVVYAHNDHFMDFALAIESILRKQNHGTV